jgi:molybdopterin-containing oxidoreductase family membrane subunit
LDGLGISRTLFGGLVLVTQELDFLVLLLFRQRWRMAINRSAEAMTIFSYSSWFISNYSHGSSMVSVWVLPIPNQFGSLWVNFNSPLLWDVFAISTYLSVSLVFWWTGLLPDFAMLRDELLPFNKEFIPF